MIVKAVVVWIAGLLTAVPYAAYYLFFQASRDQYAVLITFILFWIFGYWGLAGPLIALVKVRRVFRQLERVQSPDELMVTLRTPEAKAAAIDLIATENGIPRFLAARVYALLIAGLEHRARQAEPERSARAEGS